MLPGLLKSLFKDAHDLYDRINLSIVRTMIDPDYIELPKIGKLTTSMQTASTNFISNKGLSGDLAPRPTMKIIGMLIAEAQIIAKPAMPVIQNAAKSPHFLIGTIITLAAITLLNSSAASATAEQLNQMMALANNEPRVFDSNDNKPELPKAPSQPPLTSHPALYL